MFNVGAGVGLIIIALSAQYLIAKRLKHQKVSKFYSWVAWVFAVLGGVAVTGDLGDAVGITAGGAAIASLVGLLFIGVDIADKRPDWLAFALIIVTPTMMRASGGTIGVIYDGLLLPLDAILGGLRGFLGM